MPDLGNPFHPPIRCHISGPQNPLEPVMIMKPGFLPKNRVFCLNLMKSVNLIKPYLREKRLTILAGFVCLLATDIFQLFIPRVIKWAVDDLTAFGTDLAGLSVYTLYIVGIAVMIGIFRYGWLFCFMSTARRVEEGLRNRLFEHVQTLSASYFAKVKTGDLMAHATSDMQQVRLATGIGLVTIIDTTFLGTTAVIFMAYINVSLTVFALIPVPVIIMTSWLFRKNMHRMYTDVQGTFSVLTETVRERFAGIRIIKAYNREDEAITRVREISGEYVAKNMKRARITGFYTPLIAFLSSLSIAVVLYLGGRQTILTEITPGDFVAFSTYLGLLTWPMMAIGSVTNLVQRGKASLDRINTILRTRPEIDDIPNAKPIKRLNSGILFENVMFSYETGNRKPETENRKPKTSIKHQESNIKNQAPSTKHQTSNIKHQASNIKHQASNIKHQASSIQFQASSFKIDQGMTLGIIGPPGSGKTTFLNLLPRFFDVSEGRILADGADIRHVSLRDLRSLISFMPQEPFLFAGTIRENITFESRTSEISEAELIKVAEAAALYDTIQTFPDGFETIVGEKGVVLSGGQKQRVALARSLLRKTPILILDDPISQVDTETASVIIDTIRSMAGSRTILIVSHRISAVQFADRIITLKDGCITEAGTHGQLMQNDGYYAKTFRLQQIEEELEAF